MYIDQVTGLPIGGYASSGLLHLYLSAAENIFDRSGWNHFADRHGLKHDRSAHFCPNRYEDDLHVSSLSICKSCMSNIVDSIYKGRVIFDPADDSRSYDEEAGIVHNKSLDMRVNMSISSMHIEMWHANIQAVASCDVEKTKKCRFPPCLEYKPIIISRLAQNFATRTHTHRRFCCSNVRSW
eukprot:11512953-Karenia_brevis.AAC.1